MPVTSAPETSVTVPNTPPAAAPSVPPVTSAPAEATVVVRLPSQGIFLCHPDGWRLEVKDGDVLGRTGGVHAALLGKFPVISSNHAKVTRRGADWYITDLKSTNKTFVNGARLEPEVPVKIKQNDVIVLANVTFTVSET
jgi:pSer/pThr/pTyr-binding forkhead associated (FHA) protein